MASVIELDVQFLPPSPNQMRSAHWSRIKRVREDAGWAVREACDRVMTRATTPAIVDVVVCAHGKAGDPDNYWARMKPIIDALVCEGLLVDDSPAWLTLGTVKHAKAPPRKAHVLIRITYQDHENSGSEETATGGHDEGHPSLSPSPRSDGLLA